MGVQLLLLLVLKLCIFHGSAGSSIYSSETIFSSVPSTEGVPGFARHLQSLRDNTQIASSLSDGIVINTPLVSPPSKTAPAPQTIEVPVPLMPTHNSAPLSQTAPEQALPMPQIAAPERAPSTQPHITVPHAQVRVVSPPSYIPERPVPEPPSKPEIAPTASGMPNVSASPPRGIPEESLPVPPSKSGIAPTVSDTVPPISNPPPSNSGKEYGIPVTAPPKEMSKQRSPVNHPPANENFISPIASPPKMSTEKPVAVHPSRPGIAPSIPSEQPASPILTPHPRTSRKDYRIPVAAPPREIFDHPPVKEHTISPISTPPPSTGKEDETPIAPPKADSHQLPPPSHSPTKDHAAPPKPTPSPSINKKEHGIPVAAPWKRKFDKLSPMTHSPTKGPFPSGSPSPPQVNRFSYIVPAPSVFPPKHEKQKWTPCPQSVPSIPFYKHHHARKTDITPALAPSHSDVPPTSYHQGFPATPHPPAVPTKSPVISLAPSHAQTVAPKKSGLRHHHTPPLIHGKISPIHPPSIITRHSPAPSPSPKIASQQAKRLALRPLISPLASPPMTALPPPVQVLPPPPPNRDCTSFTCSEPYTNTPPGAPCDCVVPIKVELRLGVALYTFFPLVSELATEIASGVFLKQSQVRIMGANAATQQLDKTDVLIDLVPLGEKFDNTTAFLTYEKFWHKQVAIKTSFFGDYEVLYVSYPGLPPSPPSSVIDGIPYTDPRNNGRTIHPLGVDVRRKHERGLGGGIISIIVLSSFAAAIICIGSVWLLLLKCGERTHPMAKTPRTSVPSLAKQSGAAGSTMFGSGISSASLSFGSSMTAYPGTAKTFSADEIERATDNFDDSRILGEGGFGRVYKGILEDGKEIAVKVLKRDDQQGGREFLAEVEMLSRLHHRNLVKLIGICVEDHSHSLVYELIPNGSVESHLHGVDKETAPLDWGARMKIALGAARGLAYLHEDSSPHVIHRDFKSSNILLEDDFTPKVSDFGLARTALDEGNKHISTRVMGTFGYVAPEYAMTGHLLVKSDVYSYGVVLLELLSGRKPVDMSQPEGQENLVAWARPLLTSKEGLEMIIDPTLGSNFPFDSIAKVAAIASMCVQPEVSHRPFMGEVVQALKLVCDECDVSKEAGSESCSQDYTSVIDVDARTSTGSGNLLETSRAHGRYSEYDSTPEVDRALSASDIFTTPRRFGRQSPGSFRRHSSSGPLRPGRGRQFWQRVRSLSRGSISEHAFAYRIWGESH